MKKIIASAASKSIISLFTLLFIFTLSGCSVKKLDMAQSGNTEKTSISVYCFEPGVKGRLSVAADAYSKKHPEVALKLDSAPDSQNSLEGIQKKLSQNEEPVLFNIRGTSDMKELADSLYDFSDNPLCKRVKYGLLENVTENGRVYGLPLGVEGSGILYNTEIFSAAKIDAAKITDLKSLEAAVKKLDSLIKSGGLKRKFPDLNQVFCPLNEENITNILPMLIGGSGYYKNEKSLYSSNTLSIGTAGISEKLIELVEKYSSAKLKSEYKSDAFHIAGESCAASISSSRIINDIKEEKTESGNKIAFLSAPCGKLSVGAPAYWAINKNASSEQINSALDFLNWLYLSDEGKTITIDSMYLVPAYTGCEKLSQTESVNLSVSKYIDSGGTYPYLCPGLPQEMNESYFAKKLLDYTGGKKSFKKIISEIQKDFMRLKKL